MVGGLSKHFHISPRPEDRFWVLEVELSVRYLVPGQEHCVEQEVQRSRFIAHVAPAPEIGDAQAFIESIRQRYPDASHHCWAYVVGAAGAVAGASVGASDDGEPRGTAGKPMLSVLTHSDVGDVCVVVVRYFGGTKLGKGGLVRAYGGSVRLALEDLPTVLKVQRVEMTARLAYADLERVRQVLAEHDVEISDEQFGAEVTVTVAVALDAVEALEQALTSKTHGRVALHRPVKPG